MQEIPDKWLWDSGNKVREDHDSSGNEQSEEDGSGEAEAGLGSPRPEPEPEPELEANAMLDTDTDVYQAKMGLESDNDTVSKLMELSEISPPSTAIITKLRKVLKKSGGSGSHNKKLSSQSKHQTLTIDNDLMLALPHLKEEEEEVELVWHLPDDFVEWETVQGSRTLVKLSGIG